MEAEKCLISYGPMDQARPVTYQTTLDKALRKCAAKLKKGYSYDGGGYSKAGEYDLKEDAGNTTMYPVDIMEIAQLISVRSYVTIPIKYDLTKTMRADEVKVFMDKEMCFWIMCRNKEIYTIGKLKYNRDGKDLPTK